MRQSAALFLILSISGCAEFGLSPEEQRAQEVQALREWLRGPMMETCSPLPGPESRRGCGLALQGSLAQLRGDYLTRDDLFRTELAKAKGTDEIRRLWTRTQQEAWLRGPRTEACKQSPSPQERLSCLNGVQEDLDRLSQPDDVTADPPDVRAERAVERIEAKQRARALERQRAHELDLAREQTAGQALLGLGLSGGLFRNTTTPATLPYQPPPTVAVPFSAPRPAMPPVSCSSRQVGSVVHTDCY